MTWFINAFFRACPPRVMIDPFENPFNVDFPASYPSDGG